MKTNALQMAKHDELGWAIAAAPMPLEAKLEWHFTTLDPMPKGMLELCAAAIRLHDDGFCEATTMLDLPPGVTFEGRSSSSIGNIIFGHYLEYFLAEFADEVPAAAI